MRVLLIAPGVDYTKSYRQGQARRSFFDRGFGLLTGITPPMNLLYIASSVRAAGHDVRFIDGSFRPMEEVVRAIREWEPDAAGITSTSFDWRTVQDMARIIKETRAETTVVVGGAFPDVMGETCLRDSDAIDYANAGDGEVLLVQLLEALAGRRDMAGVEGLWRRVGGRPIQNDGIAFAPDLDAMPHPAWDLIDVAGYIPSIGYYKRLPNATVVGSRGCPYRCTFCHTTNQQGNKIRYRSAAHVMEEIGYLVEERGVRDIVFWDNNITANPEIIAEISETILARGYDITWAGATRADRVDLETMRLMKRAGCWRLLFGIETGVQKNIDAVNKREKLMHTAEKVRQTHKAGIEVFATFIFGIPTETYAEGLETIRWAIEHDVDYAKFFAMGVHPGTPLYQTAAEAGTLLGRSYAQDQANVGFVPHTMTKHDIEELLDRAYREFYARPGYIAKRFMKMRSAEDAVQNLRGFLAFVA